MRFDLGQLAALSATVSEGSFDAAARALNVTPSAISQRVKALETSVGRVLVTRTKPVRPTASGEAVLQAARQVEVILDEVARGLTQADPDQLPTIAIAVNSDSLDGLLLPALAALDPPLAFDLRRADETRTAELLRDGSVIAAVTASAVPVPGCSVHPLGRMRYRARASADFHARWFSDGVTANALAHAPVVVFDRTDTLQDRYLERRSGRRPDPPRQFVPAASAFKEAVTLGLGWGMVPDLHIDDRDDLIELDGGSVDVTLYWQQWRLQSVSLERVTAAVAAQATLTLLR